MKLFIVFFIFLILVFPLFNTSAQVATCSSSPGGLCYGISNAAQCSTTFMTNCSSFPTCSYAGYLPGYLCKNQCQTTGQQGSCSAGQTCLCINESPCDLCTTGGQNLLACNDDGCGGADAQNPTTTITGPTSGATYATSVSPISLSGTASDNITVSQVEWSNNRNNGFVGGSGTATGTTAWNIDFINLEEGVNIITVAARDGAGNQGEDIITITYTAPSSPGYSGIALSEGSSEYTIDITETGTLTELAYAWGEKPNVYFLLPFANEDTPTLSTLERNRYNYLKANFAADWDLLTGNKHPLKLYFTEPFRVTAYSEAEDDWFSYVTKSVSQFEADNAGILHSNAIYVFLYPEPYFDRTYINMFGTEDKRVLAEIYFSLFDDTNSDIYTNHDAIMSNIMQHEIAHYFSLLPNNVNIPPGTNKYFWLSHPAGFSGVQVACDEGTAQVDCVPYGVSDSPTGTAGYYEAYSILSYARLYASKANFGNRDPELSDLDQMMMGIKSRYEDSHFMFYEGYLSSSGNNPVFNLVAPHDYNISNRRLFDYARDPFIFHSLYWNISRDNTKATLANSTRSFAVSKTNQASRPLLVYASNANYPGYFKVFGNNSASEIAYSQIDIIPPSQPTGLSIQ